MDRKLLAVDAACLLVYLVAASPALTGIGIHEWLGLGVLVVFFAHAAMHVDWAVEAVRSAFARPSWARTGNLALDLLIVAAFMTVTVSGIMVSGAVLPSLGLYADGYYFWDPLHAIARPCTGMPTCTYGSRCTCRSPGARRPSRDPCR